MSIFSEYFTELIDCRGMTAAQVAQLCDVSKAVISRWCKGENLPKDRERMKLIINKMRLTPEESRKLRNAYEHEILGAEHNESFPQIIELCQTLKQRRAEYQYPIPALYTVEGFYGLETSGFLRLDNKADVLQCIQKELEKSHGDNSRFNVKLRLLPEPLMVLLKQFCNRAETGQMDILLRMESSTAEKIRLVKNMLGILYTKEAVQFYWYNCSNQLGQDGQNWILSDDFCIQFSEDMSHGMLSRNTEWIKFLQWEFQELKDAGKRIVLNHCGALSYVEERREIQEGGKVIEYMPCLSLGLTERILENILYQWFPQRRMLIHEILEQFPMRFTSGNMKLVSFFTKEGLLEFMETGRVDIFPYEIYDSISMKGRCEVLRNVIAISENVPRVCYICMKEGFLDMKGIHIEQWMDSIDRLVVEIHFDHKVNVEIEIADEDIKKEFYQFYEWLSTSDYVYTEEETRRFMIQVLEKYSTVRE